jgi:glycosyltransferase involved in cell wall biosynthesis
VNILQINSSFGWGGREMYPLILSKKLSQKGHKVRIITNPKTHIESKAKELGLVVTAIRIKGYFNPRATLLLRKIIHQERIDVIHLHFSKDIWWVIPALYFSPLPVILTKHIESRVSKKDILHRLINGRLDGVIAVSEMIKKNFLKTTSVKESKVATIYCGLDLERYHPEKEKNGVAEFRLDSLAKVVGIVGRLCPGKGQEDFLKAAKLILKVSPETTFMIVGEDIGAPGYKNHLKDLSQRLGISEKIIFAGHRDDVPEMLSLFDVFAFTSQAESFGLTLIEAMAMEKAVVAFDAGAVREIMEDGLSGILVPLGDISALAEAILSLLNDSERCREFGARGRKIVQEKFNIDVAVAKTEEVYTECRRREF